MSGTEVLHKVALHGPVQGLRLHPRQPDAATAAGRRVEWLVGLGERRRAQEAEQRSLQALVDATKRALAAVPTTVGVRLDQVAALAVEVGLAVAREIVGAALERGDVDPTPTVLHCLRDCVHGSDRADLAVFLHPADLPLVQERLLRHPELQEQVAAARFVADPALARGAVRAETGAGRLRYDPREVLERICAEIRREAQA